MILLALPVLAFVLLGLVFFRQAMYKGFMLLVSVALVGFVLIGVFITINNLITLYHNYSPKTVTWEQKCRDAMGLPLRGVDGPICVDSKSLKIVRP